MAYGTADQVASLSRVWTNNGSYDTNTRPSDSQVDDWLDEVSAVVDTALAGYGFETPIVQTTVVKSIELFIISVVADLCHAANSSGRFFTTNAIERGVSPMMVIRREINDWVNMYAGGFEALGAIRNSSPKDTIGTRGHDQRGNAINPIFQRDAFGNSFQNWDE